MKIGVQVAPTLKERTSELPIEKLTVKEILEQIWKLNKVANPIRKARWKDDKNLGDIFEV